MLLKALLRKTERVVLAPICHWRITLAGVVFLFAALIAWDQILLSRLAAQRESIRATGGHLSFRDFWLNLDDSQNAAVVYRYANSIIRVPGDKPGWDDSFITRYVRSRMGEVCPACDGAACSSCDDRRPLSPEEEGLVGEALLLNTRVFELLKEAQGRPGCQFGDYGSPFIDGCNPELITPDTALMRQLSRWTALRAVWDAEHGDINAGYGWIDTGLHMANGLCNDPTLRARINRSACIAYSLSAFQIITNSHPVPGALPEGLLEKIDCAGDRSVITSFFDGECCYINSMNNDMSRQGIWILRPLMITPIVMRGNDLLLDLKNAYMEPDYNKRQEMYKAFEPEIGDPERGVRLNAGQVMADILQPAYIQTLKSCDQDIAKALLARQAIALKQYKVRHSAYPPDLQALTPEFIQEVPLDPFSGGSFVYRREGEGFVLYSLGMDLDDDGGVVWDQKKDNGDLVWRCAM